MNRPKFDFICFGEVLWDLLPSGKMLGGAPMNVAYHLHNLGAKVKMISKIGKDDLGLALLKGLENKNISTELIQTDNTYPTGIVQVELDEKGSPTYKIVQPVAWDFIHAKDNKAAVEGAKIFIYGSLAARNSVSKAALAELLQAAKYKVFDVNLRSPFYSQTGLETLLVQANLVKMNEEELAIIAAWYNEGHLAEQEQLAALQNRFQLEGIILTKGAAGALFFSDNKSYQQPIFEVQVQDTIGSGDAFLAGFLYKYANKQSIEECLRFAAYMGAFVASQKGAMPIYDAEKLVMQFRNKPK